MRRPGKRIPATRRKWRMTAPENRAQLEALFGSDLVFERRRFRIRLSPEALDRSSSGTARESFSEMLDLMRRP